MDQSSNYSHSCHFYIKASFFHKSLPSILKGRWYPVSTLYPRLYDYIRVFITLHWGRTISGDFGCLSLRKCDIGSNRDSRRRPIVSTFFSPHSLSVIAETHTSPILVLLLDDDRRCRFEITRRNKPGLSKPRRSSTRSRDRRFLMRKANVCLRRKT